MKRIYAMHQHRRCFFTGAWSMTTRSSGGSPNGMKSRHAALQYLCRFLRQVHPSGTVTATLSHWSAHSQCSARHNIDSRRISSLGYREYMQREYMQHNLSLYWQGHCIHICTSLQLEHIAFGASINEGLSLDQYSKL